MRTIIGSRHVTAREIQQLGRIGAFDQACQELRDFAASDGRSERPFVLVLADDNGREFTAGVNTGRIPGMD